MQMQFALGILALQRGSNRHPDVQVQWQESQHGHHLLCSLKPLLQSEPRAGLVLSTSSVEFDFTTVLQYFCKMRDSDYLSLLSRAESHFARAVQNTFRQSSVTVSEKFL